MPRDEGFHEYVMSDVFGDMPDIISRAMFGGWGIYKNGKIFAIITDGELYFKVGDSNRADYEKRGSKAFVYTMPNGKKTTMSYWLLPEEIMEDREQLESWIEKAAKVEGKKKGKR